MYINNLCDFWDAVRRKRPEKWRTNSRLILHDNAPAHRPVLVEDFLVKNKVITPEHLPYSPDLAPAHFYLFPLTKISINPYPANVEKMVSS